FDVMDGFGTSSAIWFFFSGPIDASSLPASGLTPALTDSVFCADAATATPVPILVKFGGDGSIPNVLGVLHAPGRPLAPRTPYTGVVRRAVTGGGQAVTPSADWLSVRDGTSANTDADAIFDPVLAVLAANGVAKSDIAGMTVFTTESTTADLVAIRDQVLPAQPVPTAEFASRPELVFKGAARLEELLGRTSDSLATVATGFYGSPSFQTPDPNAAAGPLADFPLPPDFVNCAATAPCETTDERFVRVNG